jgi:acyl-CoA synthetase (NDP forming)
VGIAGGGGGATVLSADYCEEAGFDVVPLPDAIRQQLKRKGVPIWDWIGNPADKSIMRGSGIDVGDVVQLMEADEHFDLIITILRLSHRRTQVGLSAEAYLKDFRLEKRKLKPLMAVVDERTVGVEEYDSWSQGFTAAVKASLVRARIPFYPTVGRAINVAGKMVDYYRKKR